MMAERVGFIAHGSRLIACVCEAFAAFAEAMSLEMSRAIAFQPRLADRILGEVPQTTISGTAATAQRASRHLTITCH